MPTKVNAKSVLLRLLQCMDGKLGIDCLVDVSDGVVVGNGCFLGRRSSVSVLSAAEDGGDFFDAADAACLNEFKRDEKSLMMLITRFMRYHIIIIRVLAFGMLRS